MELELFLPNREGTVITNNGDFEAGNNASPKAKKRGDTLTMSHSDLVRQYDPFQERNVANPTTDWETFTHLLKASLGSGILSMPLAFKHSGLTMGLLSTIFTAILCTYCSYTLVKCAHLLYHRTRVHTMSYADVAQVAFENGPKCLRKFSKVARSCVLIGLFTTYFGAVSCYTVITAKSFSEVLQYHLKIEMSDRIYILSLLPALVLLGFIPNLKALAPFSLVANIFMGIGLGITLFYLSLKIAQGDAEVSHVKHFPESIFEMPATFSIIVFAMEAIGLMLPLENNMEHPKHFLGLFGVLNKGMTAVAIIYIIVGMLGYVCYGDSVQDNITGNLKVTEIGPQCAKIFIALSVLLSYVLQYFVCVEIIWDAVKDKITKRIAVCNYAIRACLIIISVLLAVLIPNISSFVILIGALCFSFLGILFPVFIEIATYWEMKSISWPICMILKNVVIVSFGITVLCSGTYTSLDKIIKDYSIHGNNANYTTITT